MDVPYPKVFLETTYISKSLDHFKRGHFLGKRQSMILQNTLNVQLWNMALILKQKLLPGCLIRPASLIENMKK